MVPLEVPGFLFKSGTSVFEVRPRTFGFEVRTGHGPVTNTLVRGLYEEIWVRGLRGVTIRSGVPGSESRFVDVWVQGPTRGPWVRSQDRDTWVQFLDTAVVQSAFPRSKVRPKTFVSTVWTGTHRFEISTGSPTSVVLGVRVTGCVVASGGLLRS